MENIFSALLGGGGGGGGTTSANKQTPKRPVEPIKEVIEENKQVIPENKTVDKPTGKDEDADLQKRQRRRRGSKEDLRASNKTDRSTSESGSVGSGSRVKVRQLPSIPVKKDSKENNKPETKVTVPTLKQEISTGQPANGLQKRKLPEVPKVLLQNKLGNRIRRDKSPPAGSVSGVADITPDNSPRMSRRRLGSNPATDPGDESSEGSAPRISISNKGKLRVTIQSPLVTSTSKELEVKPHHGADPSTYAVLQSLTQSDAGEYDECATNKQENSVFADVSASVVRQEAPADLVIAEVATLRQKQQQNGSVSSSTAKAGSDQQGAGESSTDQSTPKGNVSSSTLKLQVRPQRSLDNHIDNGGDNHVDKDKMRVLSPVTEKSVEGVTTSQPQSLAKADSNKEADDNERKAGDLLTVPEVQVTEASSAEEKSEGSVGSSFFRALSRTPPLYSDEEQDPRKSPIEINPISTTKKVVLMSMKKPQEQARASSKKFPVSPVKINLTPLQSKRQRNRTDTDLVTLRAAFAQFQANKNQDQPKVESKDDTHHTVIQEEQKGSSAVFFEEGEKPEKVVIPLSKVKDDHIIRRLLPDSPTVRRRRLRSGTSERSSCDDDNLDSCTDSHASYGNPAFREILGPSRLAWDQLTPRQRQRRERMAQKSRRRTIAGTGTSSTGTGASTPTSSPPTSPVKNSRTLPSVPNGPPHKGERSKSSKEGRHKSSRKSKEGSQRREDKEDGGTRRKEHRHHRKKCAKHSPREGGTDGAVTSVSVSLPEDQMPVVSTPRDVSADILGVKEGCEKKAEESRSSSNTEGSQGMKPKPPTQRPTGQALVSGR